MFGERRKDRRRSYSFRQHFRRARETKGLRRIVTPMLACALVASGAFAYCNSDSITGPSSGPSWGPSAGSLSTPQGTPQPSVMSEEVPVLFSDFPVTFAAATSCTGDMVNVTESKMNGSGKITITPGGGFHFRLHINYSFKGVGTTHTPVRQYVGSQEYNHETNVNGNAVDTWGYQVKVIAKGERDVTEYFPGDDFMLHVNVNINIKQAAPGLAPTAVPDEAHAVVKCQ